jgi:hypothetical protein
MGMISGGTQDFSPAEPNPTTRVDGQRSDLYEMLNMRRKPTRVDGCFTAVLGLFLPFVDEMASDTPGHAALEAALSGLGHPLGDELLKQRLWEFVTYMLHDALNQGQKIYGIEDGDLGELQRKLMNWCYHNIIRGDRATQLGVALLVGGQNVLDDGELHDLPDELAELLPSALKRQRMFLRSGGEDQLRRRTDLLPAQVSQLLRRAAE